MNLLDIVIAIPLIGFLVMLMVPRALEGVIRGVALAISLFAFAGLAWPGLRLRDDPPRLSIRHRHRLDHVAQHPLSASRFDGLSLWLVILSTFLTPICVLVSWKSIDQRFKEFFAFLLLLEFGLIGVFFALDLFLFYVFWEVALVPMYFLIGIWGHDRRIYAAVKFFLYTMAGSVLMLVAIIYLYNHAGTFDYR